MIIFSNKVQFSKALVEETLGAVESERTSRVIDHEGAGSMERRKREGYF